MKLEEAIQQAQAELATEPAADPTGGQPEDPGGETEPELDEPEADEAEGDLEQSETQGDEADDEFADEPDDESGEGDEEDGGDDEGELYTVKVDGEEQQVTLDELRSGYSRQADYTRKTQELASRRREVEDLYSRMQQWYEQRANDPAGWVLEIASSTDDAAQTLTQAVAQTGDPTTTVAWVLRGLAEGGKLDDEFVQAFNLQDVVGQRTQEADRESRLERLEREREQEREQQQRRQRAQQALAHFNSQWEQIKGAHGLEFDSADADDAAKIELMRFARENQIPNLEHAYAARQFRQQHEGQEPKRESAKAKASETVEKKRKAKAQTRRHPSSAGRPQRQRGDTDAALKESFEEVLGVRL